MKGSHEGASIGFNALSCVEAASGEVRPNETQQQVHLLECSNKCTCSRHSNKCTCLRRSNKCTCLRHSNKAVNLHLIVIYVVPKEAHLSQPFTPHPAHLTYMCQGMGGATQHPAFVHAQSPKMHISATHAHRQHPA
eukprot:1161098-Pelagomonas_calceolata.AAC.8